MKQKTINSLGYVVNGASIVLFFYLSFTIDVPDSGRTLVYLGGVLLGLGIGLVVLSTITLVRNQGEGLIERGIYGLVRHPMYLGALLCFLSFGFFLPHWLVFLISAVNIAIVYWFILQGDQQNTAKFGDAYRRYMETVPRINLLAGVLRFLRDR